MQHPARPRNRELEFRAECSILPYAPSKHVLLTSQRHIPCVIVVPTARCGSKAIPICALFRYSE
eukprot:9032146-Pyramimonas_sp.AAC.1